MSKIQKLNTKSSADSEIIGVSDYLPDVIYMHLFIEAQCYHFEENIQDNESAMRLEIDGRKSCGKRARHAETRCFCIKDL